jgi:4-diphosphocytidyl-2-C-methyl-D-erythritol kinase
VLRWANFSDLVAASRLGADIPFCLVGGRARVSGIGEVVEPLAESQRRDEPLDITLVVPPLHVSTPAVYNAWDSLDAASQRGDVNDLEPAAIVVQPELARWRDRIKEVSGQSPVLAGSGATWFLRGKHEIADALPDATVIVTQSR